MAYSRVIFSAKNRLFFSFFSAGLTRSAFLAAVRQKHSENAERGQPPTKKCKAVRRNPKRFDTTLHTESRPCEPVQSRFGRVDHASELRWLQLYNSLDGNQRDQ